VSGREDAEDEVEVWVWEGGWRVRENTRDVWGTVGVVVLAVVIGALVVMPFAWAVLVPVEGTVVAIWTREQEEQTGIYAHVVLRKDDGEMVKVIGVWEHALHVGQRAKIAR
jgi:hypothetical protein